MSELFGTPEENEGLIQEHISNLRGRIMMEQSETHDRLQRLEAYYEQERRNILRDSWERMEAMRRELDALTQVVTIKHVYSTSPPHIVIPAKDAP